VSGTDMPNSGKELTRAACPQCGNRDLRRRVRAGLRQKCIFPIFGYYPWECLSCRKTWMLRARGRRAFRRIWDEFDLESEAVPAVARSSELFQHTLEAPGDLQTVHSLATENTRALEAEERTEQVGSAPVD
jgi:hypothetical protein